MMRTVVLHGALGERFGREFRFDVASAAQAVRALIVQLKGFREHLRNGHYRVIRVRRGRQIELDAQEITFPLGSAGELHVVPEIVGAGGSAGRSVGKIIAGAALIAVAVTASFLAPAGEAFFGATLFGTSITTGEVAMVGVAIALSGVAALLTKQPQKNESFLFSGQTNVTDQGGPVPTVYGLFLTGSVLVAAGLFSEALAPGTLPFNPATTPRVVYFNQSG